MQLKSFKLKVRAEWMLLMCAFAFCFVLNSGAQIIILGCMIILLTLKNLKVEKQHVKCGFLWYLYPLGIVLANNAGNAHWIAPSIKFVLLATAVSVGPVLKISDVEKDLLFVEKLGMVCAISVILERLIPRLFFSTIYKLYSVETQMVLQNQVAAKTYYSGIAPEPSIAAGIIVFAIISVVASKERSTIKYILLVGGMLLTGKRSHIVFLAATLVVNRLLQSTGRKKFIRFFTIMFGSVLFVFFIFRFLLYFQEIIGIGAMARITEAVHLLSGKMDDGVLNYITSGRYSTYKAAWEYFLKNPIRGIGWGTFGGIYYNEWLGTYLTGVHNAYLQFLCEGGLLGFLSFVIPSLATLKLGIARLKNEIDPTRKKERNFSVLMQAFFLLYSMTEVSFDLPIYYISYYYAVLLSLKLPYAS